MNPFVAIAVVALALNGAHPAQAAYPEKPIRIVVPFAPGGSASTTARLIGARLTEFLRQPVVVDNIGGANGGVGAQAAARAPADGYTLFFSSAGIMTANPALYRKLTYSVSQFDPVSLAATYASFLYVNNDFPARDLQGLLAHAKARPGEVTYGSAGPGSSAHLWGEVLARRAGIEIRHVAYRGIGPAFTDVVGGQITFTTDAAATGMPLVKAGKLRALAVTSATRVPMAPEVPTFLEQGLPGFELLNWYGIFVPAGTPKAIVDTLHQAIARAAASRDYQDQLKAQGMSPVFIAPAALGQQIQKETAYWAKVIRDAGISLD